MITAAQLRAARVLLGIDQRRLAELSGLSVPTIQRMEASETMVRGNVDLLVKLITALDDAGIELIDDGANSDSGGRGVRLKAGFRRSRRRQDVERSEDAQIMSAVVLQMICVAGLLGLAVLAIVLSRSKIATAVIYGATLAVSGDRIGRRVALAARQRRCHRAHPAGRIAVAWRPFPSRTSWPRFSWSSSIWVRHWQASTVSAMAVTIPAPHRVLPFFPAFLAGMNLVVLADDAFSYLLCWEFMSLASWALVMAHHREAGNAKAGYVYLVMASFGTLALLLAFGLLAGPAGDYGFAAIRAAPHTPTRPHLVLILMLLGAGSKAGLGAAACLAAARPSGGAEPRFGADERRHDEGRDLRFHSRRVRSAGAADLVGERGRAVPRQHHRRHGHPLRHDGKGSEAPPGLLHHRSKTSASSSSASALRWPFRPTA